MLGYINKTDLTYIFLKYHIDINIILSLFILRKGKGHIFNERRLAATLITR